MSETDNHFKYFKVFYSKDVNKKKRVFSEGILACENKRTKLFNQEGEMLLTINEKNSPSINEQYTLNYKYVVQIDAEFDRQLYSSGKIFMPGGGSLPLTNAGKNVKPFKIPVAQTKNQPAKIPTDSEPPVTLLKNNLKVENILYDKLREHQIEGVQFMYDCLLGFKSSSLFGCILADFMGLGKTLQTITLIYSLLKMKKIKKAIVIAPLTLVSVWQKQCKKWLGQKLSPLIGLGDGEQVAKICKEYANNQYRLLVLSYESFYRYIDILDKNINCDLLIFDEGHRLKNKNSKLYKRILTFSCKKRVLLTGTPLQNNLDELYTCISIVNPNMFGSQVLFKNVFQKPILIGMGKKATQLQRKIAVQRTIQLAHKIKIFSLRRKADTLEKYLPMKRQYFVMFKMTNLQKIWYDRIRKKKQLESDVLSYLNLLRKLFTHPQILKADRLDRYDATQFLEQTSQQISYKMQFIINVCKAKAQLGQKVIIVSYFTSTLDFIGNKLKQQGITIAKLDGRSDGMERQHIVTSFQKQKSVLLLSGKAGGTGLTLICARTMIMVEPDWNPSNDAQVIGRIWRQGQTQQVQIFRLLMISSFEQRIIQRQQLKQYLSQKLIDENKSDKQSFDYFNMRKLFIEAGQKSIIFKENENCLKEILTHQANNNKSSKQYSKGINGIDFTGALFIYCKRSHQSGVAVPKNEFDDGNFLLNGLIEKQAQGQGDQKSDEIDQKFDQSEDTSMTVDIKKNTKPIDTKLDDLQTIEQWSHHKQSQLNNKDIIIKKSISGKIQLQEMEEYHSRKLIEEKYNSEEYISTKQDRSQTNKSQKLPGNVSLILKKIKVPLKKMTQDVKEQKQNEEQTQI